MTYHYVTEELPQPRFKYTTHRAYFDKQLPVNSDIASETSIWQICFALDNIMCVIYMYIHSPMSRYNLLPRFNFTTLIKLST